MKKLLILATLAVLVFAGCTSITVHVYPRSSEPVNITDPPAPEISKTEILPSSGPATITPGAMTITSQPDSTLVNIVLNTVRQTDVEGRLTTPLVP